VKICNELNEQKLKIEEAEKKVEEVKNQVDVVEEELFTNMALTYKLAKMNEPDIPILTTTISDLYTDAKNKNLSKMEWPHFLLTALTENSSQCLPSPDDISSQKTSYIFDQSSRTAQTPDTEILFSSPLQIVGEERVPVVEVQEGGVSEVWQEVPRLGVSRLEVREEMSTLGVRVQVQVSRRMLLINALEGIGRKLAIIAAYR